MLTLFYNIFMQQFFSPINPVLMFGYLVEVIGGSQLQNIVRDKCDQWLGISIQQVHIQQSL